MTGKSHGKKVHGKNFHENSEDYLDKECNVAVF